MARKKGFLLGLILVTEDDPVNEALLARLRAAVARCGDEVELDSHNLNDLVEHIEGIAMIVVRARASAHNRD